MKTHLLFLILLSLILSGPASPKVISSKDKNILRTGTSEINFRDSDTTNSFDSTDYSIEIQDSLGTKINLGKWRGKNLLLIYAHSDCPYCKSLVKKYEAGLKSDDVQVIVLFAGGYTNEIEEFRKETSLKYPYYLDSSFQFKKTYGTHVVPVTLFINSDGTAERISGLKEKQVDALINRLNLIRY